MNLLNKTKEFCRIYDITPARTKGQNFLIKEEIYDKIIEAADLKSDDVVLEVGPGLGFLTVKLARRVKKVIAVELDDKLANVLRIGLASQGIKNAEVVNEDILTSPLTPLLIRRGEFKGRGDYKIVANLPYNITSVFLRKFLSSEYKPSLMVLMLQKEVAERITAVAGKMSLLAVSVQFYSKPEIIQIVSKNNFWPKPEVDSAIVSLTPNPSPNLERGAGGEAEFFRLVKIGFSARRKMLKNNLANGCHIPPEDAEKWLKKAGFDLKTRAQELSVADWLKILEAKSGNVV